MPGTMLETSTDLQDAVADLQQEGIETTLSTENGEAVTLEDPRRVVEALSIIAEGEDPGTSPWPTRGGDPVEYVQAENAREIGEELITRVRRLNHLRGYRIHYLFRHKETWEKSGRAIYGQMKRPSGLLKSYADADFIVLLHWQAWDLFNPMQRVALVYHELRHGDAEGKIQAHDFEGFFDELRLFGVATYSDWNRLAAAARKGERYRHQHSLPLFEDGGE